MTSTEADLLAPGLRVVIAGTRRHSRPPQRYYAAPGNHFWTLLHQSGLVPERLEPEDAPLLLRHGVGLTDVILERVEIAGREPEIVIHAQRFATTMARCRPATVAFVSKTAAAWYARGAGERAPRGYGPVPWTVAGIPAFVLPGPSGANNAMSLPLRIALWSDLVDHLAQQR